MDDKILKDDVLEQVTGGGNHELEFGSGRPEIKDCTAGKNEPVVHDWQYIEYE